MTEYLDITGGRIAYDVIGEGPLLLLGHGLADNRTAFRFLAPKLAEAGYRVATFDLRGHGESSTGWAAYSRTDVAGDMAALIGHLGGPAGEYAMIDGAGHYPHAQYADEVAAVILPFLSKHA